MKHWQTTQTPQPIPPTVPIHAGPPVQTPQPTQHQLVPYIEGEGCNKAVNNLLDIVLSNGFQRLQEFSAEHFSIILKDT
ncbi:unnamed protein product [Rotaria magnacalcarata]|uniref:Uncharacterized protein n=1 Tax=Rotaria magnacalcarata TaxID=392030 RepID=A0A819YRG5_9BILA|nr:unnamed protein product [Rotaria magnacalcarata]